MYNSVIQPVFFAIDKVRSEIYEVFLHVKKDAIIYYFIASIVFFITVFSLVFGYSNQIRFFAYMYVMKFIVPLSAIIWCIAYFFLLAFCREPRPLFRYWSKIRLIYTHRSRLISNFLLLTALSVFMSSFSTMKSLIPLVHPFAYDSCFHSMDFWVFGGNEPWLVIHSFLDSPYLSKLINICYNFWFFLMWIISSYFLLASPSHLRTRYFISWILCWFVLGNILAVLLSSAGPVFTVKLDPSNHDYDLLIQLLQDQNDWLKAKGWGELYALGTQNRLWQSYAHGKEMLGSGISAMPSMHVSIAVLMALAISSLNNKLGYVSWLYAGIIYIGSIALGWHYALDGIVSAPLTWLIWHFSGKFITFELKDVCFNSCK